ncbi:uncharacterized protein MEPE_04165 [Melanopsichium pennsylvanicum]|uniref:Uncharacterized protein n=2 Tax=Melanopsichium pennsylvanicum TaxID=63383 RepID=A0AAJ5C660_9BASI|nr:uncharacterized protein BN887_05160 [Melanopsichium pennsylvanicum 4]SNX85456.1 uncharacterized protein MEPE_04165 [Melanopsichium pennsylvanicum]
MRSITSKLCLAIVLSSTFVAAAPLAPPEVLEKAGQEANEGLKVALNNESRIKAAEQKPPKKPYAFDYDDLPEELAKLPRIKTHRVREPIPK